MYLGRTREIETQQRVCCFAPGCEHGLYLAQYSLVVTWIVEMSLGGTYIGGRRNQGDTR